MTWNLAQAPQACLCKILVVRVKCLAKPALLLSLFGLVRVQILGEELTRVSLHYKLNLLNVTIIYAVLLQSCVC